jgi:hypothetical protein
MTMREYVEGRGRVAFKSTFWGFLVGAFGWAAWSTFSKDVPDVKVVVGIACCVGVFSVVEFLKRTKCPRCNGSLSRLAAHSMNRGLHDGAACPHCGVSFDEPMVGPPLEPRLDAVVTMRKCVELRATIVSPVLYVAIPAMLYTFAADKRSASGIVAIAICVVAVAGAALFISRTPCPQCSRPLGFVANRLGSGGYTRTARCPGCGVGADEPIEKAAAS